MAKPKDSQSQSALPSRFAETPPPTQPSGDYSYTLEVVMGMQATLGKLTQAVETLTEKTKSQSEKLDQAVRDIHVAKVILTILGGIITIGVTFIGIWFKAYLDHNWSK